MPSSSAIANPDVLSLQGASPAKSNSTNQGKSNSFSQMFSAANADSPQTDASADRPEAPKKVPDEMRPAPGKTAKRETLSTSVAAVAAAPPTSLTMPFYLHPALVQGNLVAPDAAQLPTAVGPGGQAQDALAVPAGSAANSTESATSVLSPGIAGAAETVVDASQQFANAPVLPSMPDPDALSHTPGSAATPDSSSYDRSSNGDFAVEPQTIRGLSAETAKTLDSARFEKFESERIALVKPGATGDSNEVHPAGNASRAAEKAASSAEHLMSVHENSASSASQTGNALEQSRPGISPDEGYGADNQDAQSQASNSGEGNNSQHGNTLANFSSESETARVQEGSAESTQNPAFLSALSAHSPSAATSSASSDGPPNMGASGKGSPMSTTPVSAENPVWDPGKAGLAAQAADAAVRSEVHVAMQTDKLGNIDVHAHIAGDQLGAAITVERKDAHAVLATELPALQQSLSEKQLRVEQLSLLHGSVNANTANQDDSATQNSGKHAYKAENATRSRQETEITANVALGAALSNSQIFDSAGRLSVHA